MVDVRRIDPGVRADCTRRGAWTPWRECSGRLMIETGTDELAALSGMQIPFVQAH